MNEEQSDNKKSFLPGGGKFEVPQGYFNLLESKLKPVEFGADLPAGGSFSTPTGYFEELGKKAAERAANGNREGKSYRLWLPLMAAAASMAIFLVVYIQSRNKCESFTCLLEQSEVNPEDLMFIEEEVIAEYYLEHGGLSDISPELQEELMESLLEEDFDEEVLEAISTEY